MTPRGASDDCLSLTQKLTLRVVPPTMVTNRIRTPEGRLRLD
jgi:hypothetical protein